MKKITTLIAVSLMVLTAACNTVSGAGKDVSSAGDAVSDTAQDAK